MKRFSSNRAPSLGASALTPREKQIIEQAKLGHRNKVIAYELGIADSTVRVLLARAAAKIGAPGREELLRAFSDDPQRPRAIGV